MGATVGPVDTERFASDLKGLWTKFNSLDPEAMLSNGGSRLDDKADQEATGFLLDLVSVSEANGLKLPRGKYYMISFHLYIGVLWTRVTYLVCFYGNRLEIDIKLVFAVRFCPT